MEDCESFGERVDTGEPEFEALLLPVAEAHGVEEEEKEGEAEREAQALAVVDAVGLSLVLALLKEVPEAVPLAEAVDSLLASAEALRVGTSDGALVTAAEGL